MLLPAVSAFCGGKVGELGIAASLDARLEVAVTGEIEDSVGLATSDTLSESGAVLSTGAGGVVTTSTGATGADAGGGATV